MGFRAFLWMNFHEILLPHSIIFLDFSELENLLGPICLIDIEVLGLLNNAFLSNVPK